MRNSSTLSLSAPGFRFFLGGRTVSELGQRITREGLPIIAVLLLHATARDLSWIAALSYIAALVAAPLAGLLADRRRRRPLLIAADLLRTGLLLALAVLAFQGRLALWQLLSAFGLVTALGTLFDVADQAWLPTLVGMPQLAPANAWLSAASAIGETGGPTLMGVLIQTLGGPLTILGAAISYLASAGSLLGLRNLEIPTVRREGPDANLPTTAASGVRVLLRHPLLRPLAIAAACVSLAGGIFDALYAFFALRDLHLSPFLIGLLITGGGLGALVGSAVAPLVLRRLGLGPMALWGLLGFGLATMLVPFAPTVPLLAFAFLLAAQLLGDLLETLFGFAGTVLRQSVTPDSWLGRISGAQRLLGYVLGAVGAFAGGLVAGPLAVRGALLLGALCALCGLVFILRSPLPSLAAAPAETPPFPA